MILSHDLSNCKIDDDLVVPIFILCCQVFLQPFLFPFEDAPDLEADVVLRAFDLAPVNPAQNVITCQGKRSCSKKHYILYTLIFEINGKNVLDFWCHTLYCGGRVKSPSIS